MKMNDDEKTAFIRLATDYRMLAEDCAVFEHLQSSPSANTRTFREELRGTIATAFQPVMDVIHGFANDDGTFDSRVKNALESVTEHRKEKWRARTEI